MNIFAIISVFSFYSLNLKESNIPPHCSLPFRSQWIRVWWEVVFEAEKLKHLTSDKDLKHSNIFRSRESLSKHLFGRLVFHLTVLTPRTRKANVRSAVSSKYLKMGEKYNLTLFASNGFYK